MPLIGVVENMSYFLCPHCGGRTTCFRTAARATEAEKARRAIPRPMVGRLLHMPIRETSDARARPGGGQPAQARPPAAWSSYRCIARLGPQNRARRSLEGHRPCADRPAHRAGAAAMTAGRVPRAALGRSPGESGEASCGEEACEEVVVPCGDFAFEAQ